MKILILFTNKSRSKHCKICKTVISTHEIYQKFLSALFGVQQQQLLMEMKRWLGSIKSIQKSFSIQCTVTL